jgi:hypothetical protein
VIIDEFLKLFQNIEIKEDYQLKYVYINGEPIKENDDFSYQFNGNGMEATSNVLSSTISTLGTLTATAATTTATAASTAIPQTSSLKRSLIINDNSDDEDAQVNTMDIYKQRRIQKANQK